MITNELVSVCIPAYNHEHFIEECIYSIIVQTYQNIELIVIDDGSSDKTFEKLRSLEKICKKRFTHIYFQKQKNVGTKVTGNRLIDKASGKYIYMIASDDVAEPDAIKILYTFLKNNSEYVLAVGDNQIIDKYSKRIYWNGNRRIVNKDNAIFFTFGDYLKINPTNNKHKDFGSYADLLKGNYIPNGYLFLRDAFIKSGKYDSDIYLEDWYLHLQLSKLGKFKYIPEVLYSYRWHCNNTISSSYFIKHENEFCKQILRKEKKFCYTHHLIWKWRYQWSKRFGLLNKYRNLCKFLKQLIKLIEFI